MVSISPRLHLVLQAEREQYQTLQIMALLREEVYIIMYVCRDKKEQDSAQVTPSLTN